MYLVDKQSSACCVQTADDSYSMVSFLQYVKNIKIKSVLFPISIYSKKYVRNIHMESGNVNTFQGVKDAYNGMVVRSSLEPHERKVMEQLLEGSVLRILPKAFIL